MVRDQFILDLNQELIVDNFAGGGGASMGIEKALGRHVDHAINHDALALGMHRINHPQTVHHPSDVFEVDPAKLAGNRRVGFGWFSPDCKHFSKAKGGKPLDKKIRGLVLVILKWAKIRTRVITMENVEEIKTWSPLLHHPKHPPDCSCLKPCGKPDPKHKGRTWRGFLDALSTGIDPDHPDLPEMLERLEGALTREELVEGFGYDFEVGEIRACDVGSPTIRRRLIMIARCDGRPIVWPADTHADPDALARYEVRGPAHMPELKPHRIIAECIDWWRPCPSIFLTRAQVRKTKLKCRRPLKTPTLRRVATGVGRYVIHAKRPFIVNLTHQGGERIESVDEPAKTLTGANRGEKALCDASFTAKKFARRFARSDAVCASKRRSFRIGADGLHHGLSCAYLAQHNAGNNSNPGHEVLKPISTVSGKGSQQQLVSASIAAYYGSEADGQAVDEPSRAVTAKPRFGLAMSEAVTPGLTPEQLAGAQRVAKFLRKFGVKFEGEFATVGEFVIIDIGMRMLVPRELFRAQGFPEAYVIDRAWLVNPKTGELREVVLSKEAQIRMCGNSVCPDVAAAIAHANVPEMAVWSADELAEQEVAA